MKKLTLLVATLLVSTMAFSQDFLMGPRAKNAQVGKLKGPKITMVHESNPSNLQGPAAKNTTAWMGKSSGKLKVGFRETIDNPMALEAKNRNPWDRKPAIPSKAAFEESKTMKRRKSWIH